MNKLNKFSPLREPKVRKEKPLWFSNTLKNLRTKRNLAHKRWKQNPHEPSFLSRFKKLRTKFEQAVKTSKKQYYWNKFKSCIGDSRQTYKLLNELNGNNKTQLHVPLLQTCREIGGSPTDNDITEILEEDCKNKYSDEQDEAEK